MQSIKKVKEFKHDSALLYPTVQAVLSSTYLGKKSEKKDQVLVDREFISLESGVFVDATFGRGGHSRELLKHLGKNAKLFVFDRDPEAIISAHALAEQDNRVTVIHSNFSLIKEKLNCYGINSIDGIILDLGVSHPQIENEKRGFSFMRDGPLDMRMDITSGVTLKEWIEKASEKDIKRVLKEYSEERFANQIAKKIVISRQKKPFNTTIELANCISKVVKTYKQGKHPATRAFQAFRIHINEELNELISVLFSIVELLNPGARLSIISFHSIEDRIVKKYISAMSDPEKLFPNNNVFSLSKKFPGPLMYRLGKIFASKEDILINPKERSAILRIAQRTTHNLCNFQKDIIFR